MSPDRIARALNVVTHEARSEALPALDWDAIEEQLPMTRVHTLPPRAFSARPWLYAATFLLASGGLGLAARQLDKASAVAHHAAATVSQSATPLAAQEMSGDLLALGAHVRSGDLPQAVVHAGHARWTLAPHSEATLLAKGDIVTVRLDHGGVTSRVTKSSKTETFAVEAADVRVAAHGTEFVVILGTDGVSVSVTEGSVLIGPREEPGTGDLLISPAAKRYTLAGLPFGEEHALDALGALRPGGARGAHANDGTDRTALNPGTDGPSAASLAAPGALGAKHAATHKAAPAETAPAEAEDLTPDQPTPDGLESATNAVLALTQTCFKERTIAGEGVRVTAQSSLTFRTLPAGGVSKVVFEPPLSPAVQACVSAGMSAIRTEATRHGFQVSRGVELER